MRKITFSILVTLDGFIDHTAMLADAELHQDATAELDALDLLLFGRRTYQLFAHDWTVAETDASLDPSVLAFARRINRIPKIVFSNTLKQAEWQNSKLVKTDAVDYVRELKKQNGGTVGIAGSTLAHSLMQADLIDEYRFLINPVILGIGQRLFQNDVQKNLKLVGIKRFGSGVVALTYQSKPI